MSRKHFEAMASAIRAEISSVGTMSGDSRYRAAFLDGVKDAARTFANVCSEANPRFDRDRFLAACGIE